MSVRSPRWVGGILLLRVAQVDLAAGGTGGAHQPGARQAQQPDREELEAPGQSVVGGQKGGCHGGSHTPYAQAAGGSPCGSEKCGQAGQPGCGKAAAEGGEVPEEGS